MLQIKNHLHLIILSIIGFALLVLTYLWWNTTGLTGTYHHPADPDTTISTRLDHSLNFPTLLRLRQPYWRNWNINRHGFPKEEVKPHVTWTGFIKLSQPASLQLEGANNLSLSIDSQPLATTSAALIQPGTHPISITYTYTSDSDQLHLNLTNELDARRYNLNANLRLYPNQQSLQSRPYLQLLTLIVFSTLIIYVSYLYKSSQLLLLLKPLTHHRHEIILTIIIACGLSLRLYHHDLIPPLHETEDEQGLAWHGISLLTTSTPTSWLFPDFFNPKSLYPPNNLLQTHWFGAYFTLGFPYFDNPPLMPLLLGAISVLTGTTNLFDSKLYIIRLIPILASTLNVYLIYLYCARIFKNQRLGLIAAFFYTFTPLIVVANRLVKEESLLATLFLLGGLALHHYLKHKNKSPRLLPTTYYLLPILSGLALLTKETSIVLPLTIGIILLQHKHYRLLIRFLLLYSLFVILYSTYGIPWGWHYQLLSFQVSTHKIYHLHSWLRLFTDQSGAATEPFAFFFYPLMLFHLFINHSKLDKFSQLLTTTYFLLLGSLIYGTHWGFFGWYKTPLYPFLAIAIALTTTNLLSIPDKKLNARHYTLNAQPIPRFALFLFTLIASLYYPLTHFNLTDNKLIISFITLLGLIYILPPINLHLKNKFLNPINNYQLIISYLLLAIFAILSTITILFQETFYFTPLQF